LKLKKNCTFDSIRSESPDKIIIQPGNTGQLVNRYKILKKQAVTNEKNEGKYLVLAQLQ